MGALATNNPTGNTVPIAGPFGTLDPGWIPVATGVSSGLITATMQTIAGDKILLGSLTASPTAAQDGVKIVGRAGGVGSLINEVTTAALSGNRTFTLPDADLAFVGGGTIHTGGVATLVAGAVTVSLATVTAASRIFAFTQTPGGTVGFLHCSARVVSTSFTITSSNVLDTSTIAWFCIEP